MHVTQRKGCRAGDLGDIAIHEPRGRFCQRTYSCRSRMPKSESDHGKGRSPFHVCNQCQTSIRAGVPVTAPFNPLVLVRRTLGRLASTSHVMSATQGGSLSAVCANCGVENPTGQNFCGNCGSVMEQECSVCGASSRLGQRFCGGCGAALTGAAMSDVTPTPHVRLPDRLNHEGELRWVTVLFVDLVGSTGIAEALPAEDVRDLLSGYFDIAKTVIGRHGGRIEKFIGDAVMAEWGSPLAREDDAERAVRAALELLSAVTTYGETSEAGHLQARAGLVTGRAATWSHADEGLVVGDLVNTASRVQSLAQPGEVLVDDTTRRSTAAAVVYGDAGEHTLRGKAQPLRLWRAARVVAGVGGVMRVDGLEADFLGRNRDLALVKELFHATAEDGRARLALVTAAAGSGKSRLGWEFEKYLDGLSTSVLWHRGRCLSYGDGVAYWALTEVVRQRLGVAEDASRDVVAAKVANELPRWIPHTPERSYVSRCLGALLGLTDDVVPPEELFAGWRLFFERLAARHPVVLMLEDLHWADAGLLDFIDNLLDWSAEHPIFLLATARPELAEQRSDWPSGRRNVTQLHLEPLPARVVAQMVRALVPQLPEEVTRKVVEQAAGIPLYAVESIRSLVDRDLVVPRDGVYTPVGDLDDLHIPVNLISLIAARLDAVPTDERALVQGLAVLGATFSRAAVAAVSDEPDDELEQLLRSLVRKEFLTVRSDPLSPERGQYQFVHDLVRSVAYDSLPRRLRKTRHLAVAQHLRSTFPNDGDEVVELVAAHYHDAFRAAHNDPDADNFRAEAIAAYERAGRRAAELGAPDSAEQAYLSAADLTSDSSVKAQLMEAAGDQALQAAHYSEALELFMRVRNERASPSSEFSADFYAKLGRTLQLLGRPDEAIRLMESALSEINEANTVKGHSTLLARLGRAYLDQGRLVDAERLIDQALAVVGPSDSPRGIALALDARGWLCEFAGNHEAAAAAYTEAVQVSQRHGLGIEEEIAQINLGWSHMIADDPLAWVALEAGVKVARRLGDRDGEAIAERLLAERALLVGDWDACESHAEAAMAAYPEGVLTVGDAGVIRCQLDLFRGRAIRLGFLSNVANVAESELDADPDLGGLVRSVEVLDAWDRGDQSLACRRAVDASEHCLAFVGPRDETFRMCWPLAIEAALSADLLAEAEHLIQLIADPADRRVSPYLVVQRSRFRGLLTAARKRSKGVEKELTNAVDGFRALGYPYWQARAQLDLGHWLADRSRLSEALPMLVEAGRTFARLGARPALEDTHRLLGSVTATKVESRD